MPTSNYCWLLYFWLNLYCIFSLYISNFPKKCQIGYLKCRCRLQVRDPSKCVLKVKNFWTKYFLNSYWILMHTLIKSSVEQFKVDIFSNFLCMFLNRSIFFQFKIWKTSRSMLKKHSVTKNCPDLSLFEQIVLVISKILQILGL